MGFFASRGDAGARRSFRLLLARAKTLALYGAGAGAVVAAVFALWESGSLDRVGALAAARAQEAAARTGFRVAEVTVTGRARAPQGEILARLGIRRGMPVFAVDLAAARESLKGIAWVRDAAVSRRLPDTIAVTITERVPAALWRDKGAFYLVDAEGVVLSAADRAAWPKLPLVLGQGAPARVAELSSLLAAEPALAARVVYAALAGGRRWDLRLADGVTVLLPEKDAGLALARLGRAQERDNLLARDVARIDLRLPDRMVVRAGQADPKTKSKT